ncbi:bifunctional transcriptional activator/DNA repair enzyme AdaA [Maritalea myrionectae]|uniref:bifunctional transcriptional activator/DNA repair enzyme AdaA n=1 Tax=Maritalea myrionectae TaxID=454601 RepID=UPI00040F4239|nr:trifunctional transcriptional activator/DNA repair protein Ada/methylated-DNA--[protein]-cysteine S-methyltransferase [Maritalea myrionectae]
MLFQLPNDDQLYQALLNRDPAFDGRVFVGVASTRIFCRLTCPARKPKRENCTFFETASEALEMGYRACKKCHPTTSEADGNKAIRSLVSALEERPDHFWQERDIVKFGLDPSTVRRAFKRQFGITFLEMARLRRLRKSFTTLQAGGKMIDAQLDAGFSSASAFRTAFAKHIGLKPSDFCADAPLKADWFDTPLGTMVAVADATHLHLLEFHDRKALPTELGKLFKTAKGQMGFGTTPALEITKAQLAEFFTGDRPQFDLKLALHGTAFTNQVWRELQDIPVGETTSYGALAKKIGQPNAARAVARANGANQIAIIIPCHRVIGADGQLTGYGGGLWRKQKLIDLELKYNRARLA